MILAGTVLFLQGREMAESAPANLIQRDIIRCPSMARNLRWDLRGLPNPQTVEQLPRLGETLNLSHATEMWLGLSENGPSFFFD